MLVIQPQSSAVVERCSKVPINPVQAAGTAYVQIVSGLLPASRLMGSDRWVPVNRLTGNNGCRLIVHMTASFLD